MSARTIIVYKAYNGYFYQDDDRCLFAIKDPRKIDPWSFALAEILSQITSGEPLINEDSVTVSDLTTETELEEGSRLVIPKGTGFLVFRAETSFLAKDREGLEGLFMGFLASSVDIMEQNGEYTFTFPVAPPPPEEE